MGWIRKKLGLGTGRKRFTKEELAKLSNDGGVYELYPCGTCPPIYVGRASGGRNSDGKRAYGLKHRLQSYDQKDDFTKPDGHPTKKALRGKITHFDTVIINDKKERRAIEKQLRKLKAGNFYKHNHN